MSKEFDFNQVGKRMPYTVPEGFFEQLEAQTRERVEAGKRAARAKRRFRFRLWGGSLTAVAAAVALFFVLRTGPGTTPQPEVTFSEVEQAFGNLSSEDREYILAVYQDDPLLDY